jgi:uncharacterized membrane protein (DUF441 family)
MKYRSIRFAGCFSLILSAASLLGVVVLTFGPWGKAADGQIARTILMISLLTFAMLSTIATNVVSILETQGDEIAALRRQLAEQRPGV